MKLDKQKQAKKLRSEGKSIRYISKLLDVSKGSVSLWVKDIILTEQQKENLLSDKNNNFKDKFCEQKKKNALDKRKENQEIGKIKAMENNILHCMGCMLFWAEGTKNKNQITFTNSDVHMMKLFIRFLKECMSVSNEQISLTLNCFLSKAEDILLFNNYWVKELNIFGCKIKKPTIKITANKIENYGICRISVFNTEKAQQIYGAIQQYAEFNNDFCLDNKRTRK